MMHAMLGNTGLYVVTKGTISAGLCPRFVFKCVSARNVRSPPYLGLEKGFVVAATNKVISISSLVRIMYLSWLEQMRRRPNARL